MTDSLKSDRFSAICEIHVQNMPDYCTGFLCDLNLQNNQSSPHCRGLLTNYHFIPSLGSNIIKIKTIGAKGFESNTFSLISNNIIMAFTNDLLDTIFLEFSDTFVDLLLINKCIFISISQTSQEFVSTKKVQPIYFLNYLANKTADTVKGIIVNSWGTQFKHNVNTYKGSSGAPVFNNDFMVIGIHRGNLNKEANIYYATKMQYVLLAIDKHKQICKTKLNKIEIKFLQPRPLLKDEMDHLTRKTNLVQYDVNDWIYFIISQNSTDVCYFYRTFHFWYWTKLDPKIYVNFTSDWLPIGLSSMKLSQNKDISNNCNNVFNFLEVYGDWFLHRDEECSEGLEYMLFWTVV